MRLLCRRRPILFLQAGAISMGGEVSKTISKGVLNTDPYTGDEQMFAWAMVCVLSGYRTVPSAAPGAARVFGAERLVPACWVCRVASSIGGMREDMRGERAAGARKSLMLSLPLTSYLFTDCCAARLASTYLRRSCATTLLATIYGYPISATHSIIASLVAVGLASKGGDTINGAGIAKTCIGWVASPLAGLLVSLFLHLLTIKGVLQVGPSKAPKPCATEATQPSNQTENKGRQALVAVASYSCLSRGGARRRAKTPDFACDRPAVA